MSSYSGQLIVWVNIEAANSSDALDKLAEVSDEMSELLLKSNFGYQAEVTADTVYLEE